VFYAKLARHRGRARQPVDQRIDLRTTELGEAIFVQLPTLGQGLMPADLVF
jgi:hypothetical protein